MEVVYLYCVFSYLFMVGVVAHGWSKYDRVGLSFALLMSPIMAPVIAGVQSSESAS